MPGNENDALNHIPWSQPEPFSLEAHSLVAVMIFLWWKIFPTRLVAYNVLRQLVSIGLNIFDSTAKGS